MKIHIFNDSFSASQDLQPVANGMYPVYGEKDIIANIISSNSEWIIKLSQDFRADNQATDTLKLQQYRVYTILSKKSNEFYRIVITPKYYPNAESYSMQGVLTIGSNPSCDIVYPVEISINEYIKLIQTPQGFWLVETNSKNFFTESGRINNGQPVRCGDYIFFYGLKTIILNDRVIICTPSNLITIKNQHLTLLPPSKPLLKPYNKDSSYEDSPLYTEADFYQKPPRLNYVIEEAKVDIDEPPAPEKMQKTPLIVSLGPQITMLIASGLSLTMMVMMTASGSSDSTRIILMIASTTITMLGALLWPAVSSRVYKKIAKKHEELRQTKYKEYLALKKKHLDFICENQKQTLLSNNPSPEECFKIVQNQEINLWQRNNSHEDFLDVRVGLGLVETKLKIEEPKEKFSLEEDDNLFLLYRQIVRDSRQIKDAPVSYSLTQQTIGAIAGNPELVKEFMDCLFAQILTFHSYSDLKIVVYTKEPQKWEYLKSVPHCWENDKSKRYFTTSIENFSAITQSIEKIFDSRKTNAEEVKEEDNGQEQKDQTTFKDYHPYYLFFIDDISDLRNNSLINKILRYKRNLGFSILTNTNSISMLPSETNSFVSITENKCIVISGDTNKKEFEFIPDLNKNRIDMTLFAQKLANIPVQIEKGKFELPKSIPFLELFNCGRVEQLNSLARWKDNIPYNSLSVPIGIDQNNEIFKMDIHEKAYGPHGLIAGTTGSGKSEWIISFILSLAVNYSPEEIQFVLIDYKGGGLAKSFENTELKIKLPHLAGTITNLDKSEIFRSISAIESELKRRQSMFNDAREKLKQGTMDIYKYQQCYREGKVNEPLSHLLIICDEFAELKQQEPDFMEQLISTARVGRSLGVHLILATQKPSGVVNDQIWSNSKFKVALKVQNTGDSREIIKKPDAAYLKNTGSFYLQVGNDEYFNLGQVAWAGAKYYPSDTAKHEIDNSLEQISETGQILTTIKQDSEEIAKEAHGEQLLNIVQYLSDISKNITIKSKKMWLENIPSKIYLTDLRKKYPLAEEPRFTYNTIIGEYDEPRNQEQGLLRIDLAAGNIAIVGKADGGTEKLLSTIIWSSIKSHNPAEIAYYILDFGTETMKKFANFPHVGEVVYSEELDKIAGIINLLNEEIEKRKELLSEYNGSFDFYNKTSKQKLHLIVVVIKNYDNFMENIPKAANIYTEFFKECPKYGIIFIATAEAHNVLTGRIQQYFNHLIPMHLADDYDYRSLTNCRRELIPKKVVGRGICKLDATKNDSYCEFQTALIDQEENEYETIKRYAKECIDYYKCKVKQLTKIPDDVSSEDLSKYITAPNDAPIGIDIQGKQLAKYDFLKQKINIITGRDISSYIEFIYGLTVLLAKGEHANVHVLDLMGIFKKPMLDIQMFTQDKNIVFGALAKDAKERKESQDWGITIVIGVGLYKQVLQDNGQQYFNELFNALPDSKKTTYILIDNYETMRTLILEDWFKNVDVTSGIWLGQGLNSQSFLKSKELSVEDQKYNFPGLAYVINNEEYTVIKTVMDKDE